MAPDSERQQALTCFEGAAVGASRTMEKRKDKRKAIALSRVKIAKMIQTALATTPRFPKKRAYSSRPGNSTLGRTRRSLPVRGTIDRQDARSKKDSYCASTATLALRGMTNTSPWNTWTPRATRLSNQQSQRARRFPLRKQTFCSATGERLEDLCRAIAKGTYIKSDPVIKRQTAGKRGSLGHTRQVRARVRRENMTPRSTGAAR